MIVKDHSSLSALLLTGLTSISGTALAQDAKNPGAGSNELEEIVITATRQVDTVNRVPLSVTAATQQNMDERGIRTIADLQSSVPGLRLTASEASGASTIAIRGIRQQVGAATTGFYLDDSPLQKRNAAGFASVNGTPIPPLFDLDRVEVLRGPQGTLFGGGSEGGTVRYIQPQPSLTDYSTYGRAQVSTIKGGDQGYEAGGAFGGPIIQDKLGFRGSIFARRSAGYIDLTDYRNGKTYDEDANYGEVRMGRVALKWAPTDGSRVTASYFISRDETHSNTSAVNLPVAGVLTAPTMCYPTTGPGASAATNPTLGFFGQPALAAGAGCNAFAGNPTVYTAPGFTIGPLALGENQSLFQDPAPNQTDIHVASLNGELDLSQDLTLTSISSYTRDVSTGSIPIAFFNNFRSFYDPLPGPPGPVPPGTPRTGGATYVEGGRTITFGSGIPYNPFVTASVGDNTRGAFIRTNTDNTRNGFTQEFRLSSNPALRPISFVGGVFYSNVRQTITNTNTWNPLALQQLSGLTVQQRFGVPDPGFFSYISETDRDTEIAGFGEATWHIGDHLKLLAGLRITHVKTEFTQTNYGPNTGNNSSSVAAGTLVNGSITDDPVTPKALVEYSFNDDALVYLSASKGFRAGGVNQVITSVGRGVLLGQYGISPSVLPKTYEADSVWSYELGAKARLLDGRAQINASIYQIDWSNVQANVALGGDAFIVNAPSATSKGGELEVQFKPFSALTMDSSVSYNKAEYTSSYTIKGGNGFDLLAVQDGDQFALPEWTFDVGARYDFNFSDTLRAYARADYRWAKSYELNAPGNPAYTPDSNVVDADKNVNLRFGVVHNELDFNLFVTNATDYRGGLHTGGRQQCSNLACTSYVQYSPFNTVVIPRPREIGLQVTYRH